MTPEVVWTLLAAAVLELDTTYAFQLTFSRGIIAGPLLSLITGDLMAGVQVGAFTELLFADVNPLGGILPPSAVACCAVSLILHAFGIPLYIAFFFGVVSAVLFSHAERFLRKNRARLLSLWEARLCKNPSLLGRLILVLLVAVFLYSFILFSVFVWGSLPLAMWLNNHLPEQALTACKIAFAAVPWIGITTLISSFRLKTK